jgi:hypothetical protein
MQGAEVEWKVLVQHCPLAAELTWNDFVKESKSYVDEIHKLVVAMSK